MIDAHLRLGRDDRLGMQRDAGSGEADHVEIVGAVADRNGIGRREPKPGGDSASASALADAAEDRFGDEAGELAVRFEQPVGAVARGSRSLPRSGR